MTTLHEDAPRTRVRRLWFGLTIILLLVATVAFCWWWFVVKPLVDEWRPFVGTWRLESPSPPFPARPELVVEKELRFDGTIMERGWDPQTGAVEYEQPSPARWRVSNGQYQEIVGGSPLLRKLGLERGAVNMLVDSPVTWDGPDRFRLKRTLASRPTMIWSRCDHPGGGAESAKPRWPVSDR